MDKNWKRPKTLESLTKHITSSAGDVFLTLNYEGNHLVELLGTIGKGGTYASMQLNVLCQLLSIILQSPMSRIKILRKIKKNFYNMKWEYPFDFEGKHYEGIEDYIFKLVVQEVRSKKLYKKHLEEKK